MAHPDIARIGSDPHKRYSGARMQQGRPITEDDWNENARSIAEESRRALLDVIGPSGSPDGGFALDQPQISNGMLDVRISAGTLYLGGERLEMQAPEQYLVQSDWLEQEPADRVPLPALGVTTATLAYLEAWEQTVTAAEDRELFEPALGGPDTSTRVRMMRRVHLVDTLGATTCTDAWNALTAHWTGQKLGTIGAGGERVVDTTLTVTPVPGTPSGDLCNPPAAGGYLGAENQAIRVQIVDRTHLTWGFDNAAPVYRVVLSTSNLGTLTDVTFLTEPKDQAHWPLHGMVVELLAWSARLPNGETLAENTGFLTSVAATYDPGTKKMTLAAAPPAGFGTAWSTRTDVPVPFPQVFFYLRVWDRGGDVTSAPKITFAFGTQLALGTTGLAVTIGGSDAVPGDYWVIAARPSTPTLVVPWHLLAATPPNGVRRFFTPLGMIAWTHGGGTVTDDCRQRFAPLTRLRGCCTVIVGDGVHSFGDVTSVQAAIDLLPPEGGEVCVRPGIYAGFVRIALRKNVILQGCGERSVLVPPAGDTSTKAVVTIFESTSVTIRDLAVRASTGAGIAWSDPHASPLLAGITLRDLAIEARDASAIFGRNGSRVVVERCRIGVAALLTPVTDVSGPGMVPAVFLSGDDLLIERNTIGLLVPGASQRTMALGGLQIGGGSTKVEIRRNHISGGLGNGITLGSVSFTLLEVLQVRYRGGFTSDGTYDRSYVPYRIGIDAGGCIEIDWPGDPLPPAPGKPRAISEGDLDIVRIVDNTIENMGNDGIASLRFYDEVQRVFIAVRELSIEQNLIRNNVLLPRAAAAAGTPIRARGGIALASVELATIRGNTIYANGAAVTEPICGVYVQHASDLDVSLNRIEANGKRSALILERRANRAGAAPGKPGAVPIPGIGGGIVVDLAVTSLMSSLASSLAEGAATNERLTWAGGVAARIEENEVVAPNGRALELVASGEVSVHGNSFAAFSTHGLDLFEILLGNGSGRPLDFLGGAVVAVMNLGVSHELLSSFFGLFTLGRLKDLDAATLASEPPSDRMAGGDILFHDNQCELDLLQDRVASPLSSVLLLSADDVSMQNNQCNVLTGPKQLDIVFVHALVGAVSVRMTGNRMKEGLLTYLSGFSFGLFNTTTNNQGTHCFMPVGLHPRLLVAGGNTSLLEALDPKLFGCEQLTHNVGGHMRSAGTP